MSSTQDKVASFEADRKLLVEEMKQLEESCGKLEERSVHLEAQVSLAIDTAYAVTLLNNYRMVWSNNMALCAW